MIAYIMYVNNFGTQKLLLDTENGINKGITAATLELRINEPGSLEFTMTKNHPCYNDIIWMDSNIALQMKYINNAGTTVDMWWPFLGRPISIRKDMYGNMQVTCEGALAFLNDVVVEYHDHKYDKIYNLLNGVEVEYNHTKGKVRDLYPATPSTWRSVTFSRQFADDNYPFNYTKEYDKENKNEQYMKAGDCVIDKVVHAYGGILHFIYYPNGLDDYVIKFGYYRKVELGFDYDSSYNSLPSKETSFIDDAPNPKFSINDNIISLSTENVKNGVYTGVFPIGDEGRHIDTVWIDSVNPGVRTCRDRIEKAVQFNVQYNEEDPSAFDQQIDAATRDYIAEFSYIDYYSMLNYTIDAIEPCVAYDDVNYIVKPGYPIILEDDINGTHKYPVCHAIKHDLFNVQNSQYEVGPIIPYNILNEDISHLGW